ncbi:MAG TPA: DUF5666 domain-containing protein [Candidatus Limnocylindrales bacterium]
MITKVRQFGARRLLTAALAIGLVGGVAVPAIYAASASAPAAVTVPTTVADGSTAGTAGDAGQVDEAALTPAALRLGGKLLNRVVRGDLTVRAKGGTFVQVHYERGKVSAVSATSITITGPDGKGATFAVTATTKVRSQGKLEAIGDLSVGQNAMVFGTVSGSTYTAVLVHGIVARPAGNGGAPGATGSSAP